MKNEKDKAKQKNFSYQGIGNVESTNVLAKWKGKKFCYFFDRRHLFWKLLKSRVEIFILNTFRYSRFHLTQPFHVLFQQHIFCTNENKPSPKRCISEHERWCQAFRMLRVKTFWWVMFSKKNFNQIDQSDNPVKLLFDV